MVAPFARLGEVHFVGIGGAGMAGIAEVLLANGVKLSGCDREPGENTERLHRLGVEIAIGHAPEHLAGVALVVASSAIPDSNAELEAARRQGITVVRRAEMLGELMRAKYGIAVAGTHGKTTTTSLIGTVLTEAGLDPTVIVGGRLRVSGTGARLGKSEYLVAEADEFDRSFLRLQPILAVVTSIDRDHLDTYEDLDAIREAFIDFASRVPFFGRAILCIDDPNVQEILPALADRRVLTYGLSPQAELAAVERETRDGRTHLRTTFQVRSGGEGVLGSIDLPMVGSHNVQNALAAIGVGLSLGLELEVMAEALAGFGGVHRRFERLGSWRGAEVVDDYAHHPTEVEATLKAARQAWPQARVAAVFQPHLFSRTRDLAAELGRALLLADRALVTPIYPSREQPISGVTSELIVDAARRSGHRGVKACEGFEEARTELAGWVGEGDVVLTLGAGDVVRLARDLVEAHE
ncbi:MAG: UDP-N-acetylmuramate--L-alanine ligase [Thermoanaerobaculia bacterium]